MSLYLFQIKSFVRTIHPAVGTTETYTARVKWLGCEADTCAEVQNAWSNTSLHPHTFMEWCWIKHKDSCAFSITHTKKSDGGLWFLVEEWNRFWKSLLSVIFIACIGSIWLAGNECRVIIISCRTHTLTHACTHTLICKMVCLYIYFRSCVCTDFRMVWIRTAVLRSGKLCLMELASE
jgi:hypothetical protein